MSLHEALLLVRKKYEEEMEDIVTGEIADAYDTAYDKYPAVMNAAQALWARELMKGLP